MNPAENQNFHIISFHDFLYIFFRYQLTIYTIFILTVCFVVIFVYVKSEIYETSALLLVKFGRENISQFNAASKQQPSIVTTGVRLEDINSEIKILESASVIHQLIKQHGEPFFLFSSEKIEKPESVFEYIQYLKGRSKILYRALKKKTNEFLITVNLKKRLSDFEQIANSLEKNLMVSREKDSDVIKVSLKWPSPISAKKILDSLLSIYLKKHLDAHKYPGNYSFFEKQVKFTQDNLFQLEDRLQSIETNELLVSFDQQSQYLSERINHQNSRLVEISIELETIQARLTDETIFRNELTKILQTELYSTEQKKVKVQNKYLKNSIPIENINYEIETIKNQLESEKNSIKESMKQKLQILTKKKAIVEKEIFVARVKLTNLINLKNELIRLKRNISDEERKLSLFKNKLEEARISDVLDNERMVNVSIIQPAVVSNAPVKPQKLFLICISIFVGLLGGVGVAVLKNYLDHTINKPTDVNHLLDLPLLGSVGELS